MSWATKFAEVGNLAKYKFGVSQGLSLYFVKVENLYNILIWANSYCRELSLPLYYCAFLLYNVFYVNVMGFHFYKGTH